MSAVGTVNGMSYMVQVLSASDRTTTTELALFVGASTSNETSVFFNTAQAAEDAGVSNFGALSGATLDSYIPDLGSDTPDIASSRADGPIWQVPIHIVGRIACP